MGEKVWRVDQSDGKYPKRLISVLGEEAPETLYLQGNISLLELDGIGFCGSRSPSQNGFDAVRDCAGQVAKNPRFTVISGNAAGIDLEAHYHAFLAGGSTIFVLSEGINYLHIKQELKPVWDWGRVLVISQFDPDTSRKSIHAKTCDQVIVGLSKAVIVIGVGEKGGTRHVGMEAIKRNTPLHVAEYEDMPADAKGSEALLAKGGRPLPRSKPSGQVNMQKVFEEIEAPFAMAAETDQKEPLPDLVPERDDKEPLEDAEPTGEHTIGQLSDKKPQPAHPETTHAPGAKGMVKPGYFGRTNASIDLVLERGIKWFLKCARSVWEYIVEQPSNKKLQRVHHETTHTPEPKREAKAECPGRVDASVDLGSGKDGKGLLKDVETAGENFIGQPNDQKSQRTHLETTHVSEPKGEAKPGYPERMDASIDSGLGQNRKELSKDVWWTTGESFTRQPSEQKRQRAHPETTHVSEQGVARTNYSGRMNVSIDLNSGQDGKELLKDVETARKNFTRQPSEQKRQRAYFEATCTPEPGAAWTNYSERMGASIDPDSDRGSKKLPSGARMELITKESVERMRNKETKRICFETTHKSQPVRSRRKGYIGGFNVPFGDGFKRIFPFMLFPSKNKRYHKYPYWRSIRDEAEFDEIAVWVKCQGSRVFLRDCLYTSVALSLYCYGENKSGRTEIGKLECRAKWRSDSVATRELAEYCANTIMDIPLYRAADLVCAVPPTSGKELGLPHKVASFVGRMLGKEDITANFHFRGAKEPTKDADLDEKWSGWDKAQLRFDGADISGKRIILIDDLYQSGTTMQYVAMKLQEAGAYQVCGLSMVKSLSNDDNQQSWYGS